MSHYRTIVYAACLLIGISTQSMADTIPPPAPAVIKAASAPAPLSVLVSAHQALERTEYDQALRNANDALRQYPGMRDIALTYKARALAGLGKPLDAALIARQAQEVTTVPTRRYRLMQLTGELQLAGGATKEALATFLQISRVQRLGSLHSDALLKAAECQMKLGDLTAAVKTLKSLYLEQPTQPASARALTLLEQIKSKTPDLVSPFSPEERLRRADQLLTFNKTVAALETVAPLSGIPLSDEQTARYALIQSRAQVKKREYPVVAERLQLLANSPSVVRDEARLLLAKVELRLNRDSEALTRLMAMAAERGSAVDRALLDAALIHKTNRRPQEAQLLLERLLKEYPKSGLATRALWELAWSLYQRRQFTDAEPAFTKLLSFGDERERALYWLIRTKEHLRSDPLKQATLLEREFPFGFYAAWYRQDHQKATSWQTASQPAAPLPLPEPLQRPAELLSAGLTDEAATDIRDLRSRPLLKGVALPLARMQEQLGDYLGAIATFHQYRPDSITPQTSEQWKIGYPRPYAEQFSQSARQNRLSEALVLSLAKQESRFRATVRSHAGAIGLMQLMPATARKTAQMKGNSFTPALLTDPDFNIKIGTKHLRELMDYYHNNTVLVLAAYNAGATAVNRWRSQFGTLPLDEFVESIPYQETRDYVKKIIGSIPVYQTLYHIQ